MQQATIGQLLPLRSGSNRPKVGDGKIQASFFGIPWSLRCFYIPRHHLRVPATKIVFLNAHRSLEGAAQSRAFAVLKYRRGRIAILGLIN